MAYSYTWPSYPIVGVSPNTFQTEAYTALNTYRSNSASMDEEINTARNGYNSLWAFLSAIIAATAIADGSITEAKLDIHNAPTDNYVWSWNAAAGKPQWIPQGSAEDTGMVRMDAATEPQYLEDQIDDSTIVLDGSDLLSVKFDNDTIKNGASGLYVDSAEDTSQIEFDTFALTFM